MTTNYLKFDTESEAIAAVDALRDPAKGLHAKVADNPLFVELVFNAPEPVEVAELFDYDAALETYRAHVEAIQPRSEYNSRAYLEDEQHIRNARGAGFPVKSFDPERYTEDGAARITVMKGRKYDRIVSNGSQRTVHSFVNRETGEVLKAASWKAPAKHARGTIYGDADGYGVTWTGANYL